MILGQFSFRSCLTFLVRARRNFEHLFENLSSQANEKLETEFEDFKENSFIEIRIGYARTGWFH